MLTTPPSTSLLNLRRGLVETVAIMALLGILLRFTL